MVPVSRMQAGDLRVRPASPIRGWRWLIASVLAQLCWLHLVSGRASFPAVLVWLPCAGIAAGLWFVWLNRRRRGLWILAAGAGLNALVMCTNGGLMPLAPGALPHLGREQRVTAQAVAQTKDRILSDGRANLAVLDDRLTGTVGPVRIAARVGDTLVGAGVLITLGEELVGAVALWRLAAGRAAAV